MKSINAIYSIGAMALLVILTTGCSTTGGLGTTIPANVTATQGYAKSVTTYYDDGGIKKVIKVSKFHVPGENQITGLELNGSLETGEFTLTVDTWNSEKAAVISATAAREEGNIGAIGDAINPNL